MGAIRVIRYLRDLFDVNTTGAVAGNVLEYDGTDWVPGAGGGGGGAPTTATYLVGAADATLTNEIVVGPTPGGELGNTWASPTVDTVHSGSSHAATQAAAEATAAAALSAHITDAVDAHDGSAISNVPAGTIASTDVQSAINELDAQIGTSLSDAVILAPASSARNVIQPTAGAVIAAIVKAHAAQSVNLSEWQLSSGALAWGLSKGGQEILADLPAPVEADVPNSQRWQWYEDTVGVPSLRFFQRDSAGTLFRGRALSSDYDTGAVLIAVTPGVAAIDYVLALDIPDRDIITGNGYGPYFTANGEQIWAVDAWGAMYLSGPFVSWELAEVAGDSSTMIMAVNDAGLSLFGGAGATVTLFSTDRGVDGIGFFTSSPVGQQTAASLSDLWTALKDYGLLDAGSVAPSIGGAPTGATYITQTPDAGLSAEQALSALATGLVKNTTGTGVLSIGAQGTDYWAPGGTDVAVADGGTGASTAGGARTNLGLVIGTDVPAQATFDDHSARHESGGADAIKLDDLAAPDDNTDLNASITKHGLTPKLSNVATEYLDGTGAWSTPAGGASGGYPRMFKSGFYYLAPSSSTVSDAGVAQTLDRVVYVPFAVGEAMTADRIGASVTTLGVLSVVRLGIYSSTDGVPGTLLVDAGTIDAGSTGFKEITISQALSANSLYWIAIVPQVLGCSLRAAAAGSGSEWVGTSTLSADIRTANYIQAGVTGALPGTATPVTGITQSPIAKLRAA